MTATKGEGNEPCSLSRALNESRKATAWKCRGCRETADSKRTLLGWKMELVGGRAASMPEGCKETSVLGVRPGFSYGEEEM